MHRCRHCLQSFDASTHTAACPACGTVSATRIDDVPCYAPQLAYESPGFRPEHFARLARLEEGNFWFRARNELIVHVLRKHFPQARSMLEIGCGTGYVLRGITRALPDLHVSGSEIFLEGLSFAAQRLPGADLFQMDARNIPFESEFDLIGAFDVTEHIKEDEQVLGEIHRALKPRGGAIFTVPPTSRLVERPGRTRLPRAPLRTTRAHGQTRSRRLQDPFLQPLRQPVVADAGGTAPVQALTGRGGPRPRRIHASGADQPYTVRHTALRRHADPRRPALPGRGYTPGRCSENSLSTTPRT